MIFDSLEDRLKYLDLDPQGVEYSEADDYHYQPIDVVETELDEITSGLWSTDNFSIQFTDHPLGRFGYAQVQLTVHVDDHITITRSGTYSALIPDKLPEGVTDSMVAGNMKAHAIKNAAKSLGNRFGRMLNRDFGKAYTDLPQKVSEASGIETELKAKLSACEKVSDVQQLLSNEYAEFSENDIVQGLGVARIRELSK